MIPPGVSSTLIEKIGGGAVARWAFVRANRFWEARVAECAEHVVVW